MVQYLEDNAQQFQINPTPFSEFNINWVNSCDLLYFSRFEKNRKKGTSNFRVEKKNATHRYSRYEGNIVNFNKLDFH